MRRLIREPLLHFLLLGIGLFVLYGWIERDGFDAPDEIVVSRGKIRSLHAQFERSWQRPPTAEELTGLIDGWVREEIFYREGLALGFDRDDSVVRRRVAQKVELILDDATPVEPTTEELQAWLDEHPARYAVEPDYTLSQIYFDPARRGARLADDVEKAHRALETNVAVTGDGTMLPMELSSTAASDVARTFGTPFAEALATLPVGSWQGPVRSGFGLHLVKVSAREDGRNARLDEVREAVERDVVHWRTQQASKALYERLRANYTVRVEHVDAGPVEAAE